MIYDASNAFGAVVYDVDTKQRVDKVLSINTDLMQVVCAEFPIRVVGDSVATYTMRYRSIYAIQGLEIRPCLFHCYGRIE